MRGHKHNLEDRSFLYNDLTSNDMFDYIPEFLGISRDNVSAEDEVEEAKDMLEKCAEERGKELRPESDTDWFPVTDGRSPLNPNPAVKTEIENIGEFYVVSDPEGRSVVVYGDTEISESLKPYEEAFLEQGYELSEKGEIPEGVVY